ncbi:outer membrane beta-barrel protein [Arenicella sp.]|nr:outer membrane beta-barrel protein [Arenicella sp.]
MVTLCWAMADGVVAEGAEEGLGDETEPAQTVTDWSATFADDVPDPTAALAEGDPLATEPGSENGVPAALALPTSEEIPTSLVVPAGLEGVAEDDLFTDALEPVVFDDAEGGRMPTFMLPSGLTFDLGFETSLVFDDNIFLSEEKVSDTVFRFQPDLAIAFGDGRAKQEGYIEVAYRPTLNVFFENSEENSFDEDLTGEVQVRKSKVTILGSGGFQKLSEATTEVAGRFDRQVYSAALEIAYAVTEKVGIGLRGSYEGYRYDDKTVFENSDNYGAELLVGYIISPKTEIALGYGYGELDFEKSGKQSYHQAFLDAEWQPTAKIAVSGRVGAEYRDLITETQTIPLLEGGVRYQPREKTQIAFRVYSREETSPYLGGESFTATGFEVDFSQGIGSRFTALLEAGYEHADYNGGLDPVLNERTDDIWFTRVALAYQLREWLAFEAFYLYQQNDSNGGGFGYENNQAGMAAKVIF